MFRYLYYNDIRVGIEPSRPSPEPARASRANLTSARSAHERFGMASRATSEPLQWLGSLGRLAEPICVTYISCVSAQSRLNCMLPSQHSQVYCIHELIESCNIQFTRLNDN